jgi:hypothetical protein
MTRASPAVIRFVRALLGEAVALPDGKGRFHVANGERMVRLDADVVATLVSAGVLSGGRGECRASPEARQWLRRQLLADDGFAAQHRREVTTSEGQTINLNESPLSRLAAGGADGAPPYLLAHHVEAGERVRKLVDRAHLQPRMTMAYSHQLRTGGKGGGGGGVEIGDMAADARKALAEISRVLPPDCAGVVLDVCGLMKGLQVVESERGWPRRSAKLVLRIGLEQLASHFGLAPQAVGAARRQDRVWMGEGAKPREVG